MSLIMTRIRMTLSDKDSAGAVDFQIFLNFIEMKIRNLNLYGFIREPR